MGFSGTYLANVDHDALYVRSNLQTQRFHLPHVRGKLVQCVPGSRVLISFSKLVFLSKGFNHGQNVTGSFPLQLDVRC